MGNEGGRKPHYNISMSRRTRKPDQNIKGESFEEEDGRREKKAEQQRSLKQLIEGRCPLAQHFREEEKHQSIVVRPPDQDGFEGLGLKRSMVRNYAKILRSLIKVKQESCIRSWRKPALSLKLIEDN